MGALELVDDWPVGCGAVAVVGLGGVTDSRGPVDEPFALASVTKLLVAFSALVAVEEGTIALDGTAGPLGSTVRHLLAHASGLGPDDDRVLSPPGARRIYSNAGFEALGEHLAVAAAMSIGDYVSEAVLRPLAMTATTLTGSPAHGASSTVTDLAAFVVELLSPTLITAATLDHATTVQFPGLAGVLPGFGRQVTCDWGLGFEIKDSKSPHWTGASNDPTTFGHFGRSGTFVWIDPARSLALVSLTDTTFGPWAAEAWPILSDAVVSEFAG